MEKEEGKQGKEITESRRFIDHYYLYDYQLSLKATGLFTCVLNLPTGWPCTLGSLLQGTRDGRASVLSALRELENAGYLKRAAGQGPDVKESDVVYQVFEIPEKDKEAFLMAEQSREAQAATIINKWHQVIERQKDKEAFLMAEQSRETQAATVINKWHQVTERLDRDTYQPGIELLRNAHLELLREESDEARDRLTLLERSVLIELAVSITKYGEKIKFPDKYAKKLILNAISDESVASRLRQAAKERRAQTRA